MPNISLRMGYEVLAENTESGLGSAIKHLCKEGNLRIRWKIIKKRSDFIKTV